MPLILYLVSLQYGVRIIKEIQELSFVEFDGYCQYNNQYVTIIQMIYNYLHVIAVCFVTNGPFGKVLKSEKLLITYETKKLLLNLPR